MTDNAISFTTAARESFPAPTGFVTDGPRFQNLSQSFQGERTDGKVTVRDNVAIIEVNRKNMSHIRIGVFITALDPETNERVGELIFSRRMFRKRATFEVPLTAKQIPVEFGDLEVAVVSYAPGGVVARVEVGSPFEGEQLSLQAWRVAKLSLSQSQFFPLKSGAATTRRGALNPMLLNRRF